MLEVIKKIFLRPLLSTLFICFLMGLFFVFEDEVVHYLQEKRKEMKFDAIKEACRINHTSETPYCFESSTQSCRKYAQTLKELGKLKAAKKVIQTVCLHCEDNDSCYEIGRKALDNKKVEKAKKFFELACKNGRGGNMQACGELGLLIEDTEKSKKLLRYSCRTGYEKYCFSDQ